MAGRRDPHDRGVVVGPARDPTGGDPLRAEYGDSTDQVARSCRSDASTPEIQNWLHTRANEFGGVTIDRVVGVTEKNPAMSGPPSPNWFNEIASFLGKAYWAPDTGRVMAFTKGTEQEVDFVVDTLGLEPGQRLLDVGCGPGRHALALARRGFDIVGVDLSDAFVELARKHAAAEALPAVFDVLDVRALSYDAEFDAAICLCQGG